LRTNASTPRSLVAARVIIKQRVERSDEDIDKVVLSTEQLNEILADMGQRIGEDYKDKHLLVIGVLKGGAVFTADLIRHVSPVPLTMEVDFFKAASYGLGTSSSGTVKLDDAFNLATVKDKHVLVAEDIIDTGLTISSIVTLLRGAGAMSVRVAVLLDKRSRRRVTYEPDYIGMHIGDEFVVGYGIDFAERYRWLPYIGTPKPEVVKRIMAERKQQQAEAAALNHRMIEQVNGNGTSNENGNGNGQYAPIGHVPLELGTSGIVSSKNALRSPSSSKPVPK